MFQEKSASVALRYPTKEELIKLAQESAAGTKSLYVVTSKNEIETAAKSTAAELCIISRTIGCDPTALANQIAREFHSDPSGAFARQWDSGQCIVNISKPVDQNQLRKDYPGVSDEVLSVISRIIVRHEGWHCTQNSRWIPPETEIRSDIYSVSAELADAYQSNDKSRIENTIDAVRVLANRRWSSRMYSLSHVSGGPALREILNVPPAELVAQSRFDPGKFALSIAERVRKSMSTKQLTALAQNDVATFNSEVNSRSSEVEGNGLRRHSDRTLAESRYRMRWNEGNSSPELFQIFHSRKLNHVAPLANGVTFQEAFEARSVVPPGGEGGD